MHFPMHLLVNKIYIHWAGTPSITLCNDSAFKLEVMTASSGLYVLYTSWGAVGVLKYDCKEAILCVFGDSCSICIHLISYLSIKYIACSGAIYSVDPNLSNLVLL